MPSNAYTRRWLKEKAYREMLRKRYGYLGKGKFDGTDKSLKGDHNRHGAFTDGGYRA